MAYTLEQLSADIRNALKADPGDAGKQAVCGLVSKVLLDKDFVAKHLTADQCRPRKVLYEDPELGFCVCGHVYETAAHGKPHDHGSSWAIYGVAVGDTEMTDWRIVKQGDGASSNSGRAGEDLRDEAGRCAPLRCRLRSFAQARRPDQAGAHRGRQSRPHQAFQHQGGLMGHEIEVTPVVFRSGPPRRPAPGLVLLPEVFNTNPHIRSVADGYAAEVSSSWRPTSTGARAGLLRGLYRRRARQGAGAARAPGYRSVRQGSRRRGRHPSGAAGLHRQGRHDGLLPGRQVHLPAGHTTADRCGRQLLRRRDRQVPR